MKNWWQQFQSQIQAIPEAQPEDSILFRVLTQSLVSVGILATDLAAATHIGLWAIPLSVLGASWSWYRRRKKNTGFKFLIAIAMTVSLFTFFSRLPVSWQSGDTRLLLAEFLIQVQVLHTFDLPRRKDLGYSMMIGLVLLCLASTLSQTMLFGVMLIVFLAIALPVLMLDYSSRLGVNKAERQRLQKAAFRKLPLIFAIVLSLGLVLFILMPRLPGYQLRMFPVSSPVTVQEKFDNQVIKTPNTGRNDLESQVRGGGSSGQGSKKQLADRSDEFYSGFGNTISQNQRGKLKPRIVMRVRSQIEGFWRVMAFDRYTGQGWEISRNADTRTIKRLPWSYRFYLGSPVTLSRTKEVIQTFTILSDMPNLIPALSVPKELYFPTDEVAVDEEFGLRSPIELQPGMTYSVVSEVPYRDRTLLRLNSLKARYPEKSPYLQLPDRLGQRLAEETERILATSEQPIDSDYEKALYLGQYLKQRYRIRQDFELLKPGEDLVEAFLRNQGGDRDHFSTALTVMLRSIGVPTRLVTGFAPGQFNPFTGLYVVRNTDAYAMTEIYVPRSGWFTIDPIPGHELIPPSVEEYQPFSLVQRFWNWVAGWLPSPVAAWLSEIFKIFKSAIVWFLQLLTQGLSGFFTACIVLTSLGFLGWSGLQGWKRWQQYQRLKHLRPMERLYQKMLHQLARQGFQKHPAETPLEYVRQAKKVQSHDRAIAIEEISQAYVSWRYGRVVPDLPGLQRKLRILISRRSKR